MSKQRLATGLLCKMLFPMDNKLITRDALEGAASMKGVELVL